MLQTWLVPLFNVIACLNHYKNELYLCCWAQQNDWNIQDTETAVDSLSEKIHAMQLCNNLHSFYPWFMKFYEHNIL